MSVGTPTFYELWEAAEIPFEDPWRTSSGLGFIHSSQRARTFHFLKGMCFNSNSQTRAPWVFQFCPSPPTRRGSPRAGGCRQGEVQLFPILSSCPPFQIPPPREALMLTNKPPLQRSVIREARSPRCRDGGEEETDIPCLHGTSLACRTGSPTGKYEKEERRKEEPTPTQVQRLRSG